MSIASCLAAEKASSVTIMSYNVRLSSYNEGTNSWEMRYPASAMMINDQKPDVIGIQDALFEQIDYFQDILKGYKYVGVAGKDGKKDGVYTPILYNSKTIAVLKSGTFWLSDNSVKPSTGFDSEEYLTATWAILKEKNSGKKFFFINTKLDSESASSRQKALSLVMEKIPELNTDSSPVVLTGDLKMTPESDELAPVKAVLKDSRSVAFSTDKNGTFNNWGKQKEPCIYDYIWISGFSSCTSFETVTKKYYDRVFISDHFPIKAILVLD